MTASSRVAGFPVLAYTLWNLPEHFAFCSDGVYTVRANRPAMLARRLGRPEPVFAVADGGELRALPHARRETRLVVDSTPGVGEAGDRTSPGACGTG